ncbi:hypothetical protein FHS18_001845 [Paenibacillus phyllosphaerae]|uniref:Knr4/Smi1-like domain-containing protein n=1 Tax=Paenibacillus phyllosphaerae TaxID=274593 RepID=A0A7W5FM76_9BACL|nr:SMI1/KNR4 family protein [Paenibacillus phyllosphaerae]MBB3109782.1 hypothetical protein [Paenibacillus phyllosphaerae]
MNDRTLAYSNQELQVLGLSYAEGFTCAPFTAEELIREERLLGVTLPPLLVQLLQQSNGFWIEFNQFHYVDRYGRASYETIDGFRPISKDNHHAIGWHTHDMRGQIISAYDVPYYPPLEVVQHYSDEAIDPDELEFGYGDEKEDHLSDEDWMTIKHLKHMVLFAFGNHVSFGLNYYDLDATGQPSVYFVYDDGEMFVHKLADHFEDFISGLSFPSEDYLSYGFKDVPELARLASELGSALGLTFVTETNEYKADLINREGHLATLYLSERNKPHLLPAYTTQLYVDSDDATAAELVRHAVETVSYEHIRINDPARTRFQDYVAYMRQQSEE